MSKFIAFVLLAVVLVRLLSLGAYPLGSTTEPRYAEIARKMLETGNWVTPWFDHGVPFWGKPPLSFWGSAATMGLFGVNEFAARLAPFISAIVSMGLFWAWPRDPGQRATLPLAASVVFMSCVVGFIASAAVMTDMFMAMGTSLCMVSFWIAVRAAPSAPYWPWMFFVGLALGLLAKGPVATVITGVALFLWLLSSGQWRRTWQALPWVRGLLLTALLTVPWYLLAEARTPGFLHYFIVGEHLQRFLVSGWTGDLYGQGHAEARGLIWWYGFGGFLPWSLVTLGAAVALVVQGRRSGAGIGSPKQGVAPSWSEPGLWTLECRYLWAWTVAPLVFFTAARNILEAYVLPGLAAFSLLTGLLVLSALPRGRLASGVWLLGLLCPLSFAAWLAVSDDAELRSQRALLRHWQGDTPLVYLGSRPLSANFYSQGRAQEAKTPADMHRWLTAPAGATLVLQDAIIPQIAAQDLQSWSPVAKHAGYTLLRQSATGTLDHRSQAERQ